MIQSIPLLDLHTSRRTGREATPTEETLQIHNQGPTDGVPLCNVSMPAAHALRSPDVPPCRSPERPSGPATIPSLAFPLSASHNELVSSLLHIYKL